MASLSCILGSLNPLISPTKDLSITNQYGMWIVIVPHLSLVLVRVNLTSTLTNHIWPAYACLSSYLAINWRKGKHRKHMQLKPNSFYHNLSSIIHMYVPDNLTLSLIILLQVLFEKAIEHCIQLATHKEGCLSLNECISSICGSQRERLLRLITDQSAYLSHDPNGY